MGMSDVVAILALLFSGVTYWLTRRQAAKDRADAAAAAARAQQLAEAVARSQRRVADRQPWEVDHLNGMTVLWNRTGEDATAVRVTPDPPWFFDGRGPERDVTNSAQSWGVVSAGSSIAFLLTTNAEATTDAMLFVRWRAGDGEERAWHMPVLVVIVES